MSWWEANAARRRNAQEALKSAADIRQRGSEGVRQSIFGAGSMLSDTLGRLGAQKHKTGLEAGRQAHEKGIEFERGQTDKRLETLKQAGDIGLAERRGELEATGEGRMIQYLKDNGLWNAYIEAQRAGLRTPKVSADEFYPSTWLAKQYEAFMLTGGEAVDPKTGLPLPADWDKLRSHMLLMGRNDRDIKEHFPNFADFEALVNEWITVRQGEQESDIITPSPDDGNARRKKVLEDTERAKQLAEIRKRAKDKRKQIEEGRTTPFTEEEFKGSGAEQLSEWFSW